MCHLVGFENIYGLWGVFFDPGELWPENRVFPGIYKGNGFLLIKTVPEELDR